MSGDHPLKGIGTLRAWRRLGLGIGARAEVGRAALWAMAVATKGFPAALLLLVLVRRRWRFAAFAFLWSGARLGLGIAATDPSPPLATAGMLIVVVILWATTVRRFPVHAQWAWAWPAVVALLPTSWWHDAVLVVPAIAVSGETSPADDRRRLAVPIAAGAVSVLALPFDEGLFLQAAQVVLITASSIIAAVLGATPRDDAAASPGRNAQGWRP
jgi:hypothetical protein